MSAGTASRRVRAHGRVVVEAGRAGGPRFREVRTPPPLGVRVAGGEVHLIGSAGGPHGGDDLGLEVVVTAGTTVTVRSVAATMAMPGDGTPSRYRLDVVVEAGASLRWLPEPLVAVAGCDHHTHALLHLAADADLVWSDELVLGRHGQPPGNVTSTLRIVRDDQPVLHHTFGTALPGWDSPAVTAGAHSIGLVATVGQPGRAVAGQALPVAGVQTAVSRLSDDVTVAVGLAEGHAALRRALRAVLPSWASP